MRECAHPFNIKVVDELGEMHDDPSAPGGAVAPVLAWHYECGICHILLSEHRATGAQFQELARNVVTSARGVIEAFKPLPDVSLTREIMRELGCRIEPGETFGHQNQCALHGGASMTRLCLTAMGAARGAERYYARKEP